MYISLNMNWYSKKVFQTAPCPSCKTEPKKGNACGLLWGLNFRHSYVYWILGRNLKLIFVLNQLSNFFSRESLRFDSTLKKNKSFRSPFLFLLQARVQSEHTSNKQYFKSWILAYRFNLQIARVKIGALKQGPCTCSTFKPFNLTYLQVLCS